MKLRLYWTHINVNAAVGNVLIADANSHLKLPRSLRKQLVNVAEGFSPIRAAGSPNLKGEWVDEKRDVLEHLGDSLTWCWVWGLVALAGELDEEGNQLVRSSLPIVSTLKPKGKRKEDRVEAGTRKTVP